MEKYNKPLRVYAIVSEAGFYWRGDIDTWTSRWNFYASKSFAQNELLRAQRAVATCKVRAYDIVEVRAVDEEHGEV